MVNKLSDVSVDESQLLQKGYSTKDLVDRTFTITAIREVEGDSGPYLSCDIEGEGLEPGKPFNTGSHNIVLRLKAAVAQNLLPVEVKVVKLGGNAFDII